MKSRIEITRAIRDECCSVMLDILLDAGRHTRCVYPRKSNNKKGLNAKKSRPFAAAGVDRLLMSGKILKRQFRLQTVESYSGSNNQPITPRRRRTGEGAGLIRWQFG